MGFWGLGFGDWVLGIGSWVWVFGFWVLDFGFGFLGLGLGFGVYVPEIGMNIILFQNSVRNVTNPHTNSAR